MNPVSPVRKEDIHHKTSETKPLKLLSSELSNGVKILDKKFFGQKFFTERQWGLNKKV